MSLEKAVYTAKAKATGGRDGRATSSDNVLDVKLAVPKEMGGAGGGTNPEQLFAAGYSACFLGAMKFVAKQRSTQYFQRCLILKAKSVLAQFLQVSGLK